MWSSLENAASPFSLLIYFRRLVDFCWWLVVLVGFALLVACCF